MTNNIFLWFILSCGMVIFCACQRRAVCPAYHSSFILDDKKTNSFFSQFGQDSLPKSSLFVNKNKHGIIVKVKYEKKQKEINTIKMKLEYPLADSSLLAFDYSLYSEDELDSALALASARRIHHNREQQIYMRYIAPFYYREEPNNIQQEIPDQPIVSDKKLEKGERKKNRTKTRNRKEDSNEDVEIETDDFLIDF
jgi:hypothetical protein